MDRSPVVLMATCFVNGKWQFLSPYRMDAPNRSPKICQGWLRRRPLQLCQICCASVRGWFQDKWVKYNQFYLYFFGELYMSNRSKDFLAWGLKRRGIAEGCAFLCMLVLLSFRASNSPKTLQCGREFTFSSLTRKILKLAYYQNYFLDSNLILHSDKDYQMPFVGGPNTRTTNPRWRTAAILEKSKNHISAVAWPIAMKFSSVMHIGRVHPIDR